MTKDEYDLLQKRFSAKLKSGHGNKEQAYNEGILSAKSILKEVYERGALSGTREVIRK